MNTVRPPSLLEFSFVAAILIGMNGTFIGSAMWASRASTEAVIAAVVGIIFFVLIYGNRAHIGFDDPKIMVPWLCCGRRYSADHRTCCWSAAKTGMTA